jgi:hypothetical protein
MVEDESQDVASEPASGAPVNGDKRSDPPIIDGEATRVEDETGTKTTATRHGSETPPPSSPPERPSPGTLRPLALGALGGLVVSALAAAGGYYALGPKADLAQEGAGRLDSLETQAQRAGEEAKRQGAELAAIDKRIAALEASSPAGALAGLDKRIGGLEAANAALAPRIDAATKAAEAPSAELKSLRAEVDAVRSQSSALSDRVAKLESATPQAAAGEEVSALAGRLDKVETALAASDVSALAPRLDKVEAALAAPKAETRAAPEKPEPGDNPAAVALVAEALRDKLRAGLPYAAELAALQKLGVAPDKLTPLKALADGGPNDQALATSFDALTPKVMLASSRRESGGVMDRFLAHIRGLVQERDLNETPGEDPAALMSQIEADSRRGNISAALAAFEKLPAEARQAASAWAAEARARQAADQALASIRDEAIEKLAAGAKP